MPRGTARAVNLLRKGGTLRAGKNFGSQRRVEQSCNSVSVPHPSAAQEAKSFAASSSFSERSRRSSSSSILRLTRGLVLASVGPVQDGKNARLFEWQGS